MERITDHLRREHARLHARAAELLAEAPLDLAAFESFRAALLRHVAVEEKVLLPAARRARGGKPLDRVHTLRLEHGALAALLVPTPDHALVEEIAGLLREHDALEEGAGGVYEECERLFTPEESAALREVALAFPEVPTSAHFDGPNVHRTAASALVAVARPVLHVDARTGR